MAVIAKNCPNLEVEVVDINETRIKAWNDTNFDNLPVFEPGLSEILKDVRNKNLIFSTNVEYSIKNADMIFISVNTPIKKKGMGAGQTSDLRWVESCARQISLSAKGHTIVVEKSTLPVKTAQTIKDILDSSKINNSNQVRTFSVLSNPEFLAEGTAINDLVNPDRVLIGGDDLDAMNALKEIYIKWVPENKIIFTNLWSSELSKLSANALLAQRISSINSLSAICEVTGAEIGDVSDAVGMDSRIGSKFLKAGPGFGGSCFKKDILNLVYLSRFYGLNEVADFWQETVVINSWQQTRIYKEIVARLFGNLADKKIAILGFAFKENTNDTRESPAIDICKNLLNEGANLLIHDPKVTYLQIENDLNINLPKTLENQNSSLNEKSGTWEHTGSIDNLEIFKNAYAIIILTEWEEFKNLNWKEIAKKMLKPAWVFDSRSIVNIDEIKDADLSLWRIGDGFGD